MTEQQDGPLAGTRVIDVTHMLAGPFCTWLLGALGAEVIKVERPGGGDFTRSIAPHAHGESLYFGSVNREKRSLTLDLKSVEGKDILRRLAATADVLVENNRPGAMERLGLGYDALSPLNPRLVYAAVSGFGQTGPYRARPAFDAVVQAMSGLMSVTGEAGRGPVRVGASVGDITAALFATIGILAALQQRERSGRGTFVDVAMLDCQVALLENAFSRFLNTGETPQRLGTRHPLVTPFQAFEAADGMLVICCDTERQWAALYTALDLRDLAADPRFGDGSARTRNHAALEPLLAAAIRQRSRVDWLLRFEAADVPCGPVNSVADVAADPQVAARGMLGQVGANRYASSPIRMASLDGRAQRAAPTLGQDNDAILAGLGLATAEITRLRDAKVI